MLKAVDAEVKSEFQPQPGSGFSVFFRVLIPILLLASAWSLATPIDGSPDEHRHLTYAYALATGQVTDHSTVYTVPNRIGVNRSACYAFNPEESAACDPLGQTSASETVTTATSANNYPRLFYRIAGWPLGLLSNDLSVYAARLTGVLISCILLAMAFAAGASVRSRWLVLGALLATTPMVLFLIGSFNPHGLELAASLAFIVSLLTLLNEPRSSTVLTRATLVLAIPPLVLCRPNGFIWPVVLGGLVVMASPGSWRSLLRRKGGFFWTVVAVTSLSIVYGIWWQIAHASRDTAAGVIGPAADTFSRSTGSVIQILTRTQTFPGDWVGTFGWLDTRVTSATLLVWFGLIGSLLVIGLLFRPGRQLVVAGVALAVALVLTVAVDIYYRSSVGVTVAQGRYVLPLAMLAVCLLVMNASWVEVVRERLPGLLVTGSGDRLNCRVGGGSKAIRGRCCAAFQFGTLGAAESAAAIFVLGGSGLLCGLRRRTPGDEVSRVQMAVLAVFLGTMTTDGQMSTPTPVTSAPPVAQTIAGRSAGQLRMDLNWVSHDWQGWILSRSVVDFPRPDAVGACSEGRPCVR